MAIIGNHILLGYGDVGISVKLDGTIADPFAQFKFYQLDSPHFDPDNEDTSVIPITLTMNVGALELLNRTTCELLSKIYNEQSHAFDRVKKRLQTEKT